MAMQLDNEREGGTMPDVKVSIVIPVYNAGKYLEQCLMSVVNQSLEDIEIIVVNDGSTDRSKEICNTFSRIYQSIKFIDKENEGVSVARNLGLDYATGKYITFVDSDDFIEQDYCKELFFAAERNNSDITICDYQVESGLKMGGGVYNSSFTGTTGGVEDYRKELILRTLYGDFGGKIENSVVGAGVTWSKFYNLNFVKKNNVRFIPGLIRAQDTVFFLSLINKTDKICHLSCALYHYRVNNGSICSGSKYIPNSEEVFGKLIDEYTRLIIGRGFQGEYVEAFYARTIQLLFWHYTHNCFNKSNNCSFVNRLRHYNRILKCEPYRTALAEVNSSVLSRREKGLVYCFRIHCVPVYIVVLNFYRRLLLYKNRNN